MISCVEVDQICPVPTHDLWPEPGPVHYLLDPRRLPPQWLVLFCSMKEPDQLQL